MKNYQVFFKTGESVIIKADEAEYKFINNNVTILVYTSKDEKAGNKIVATFNYNNIIGDVVLND